MKAIWTKRWKAILLGLALLAFSVSVVSYAETSGSQSVSISVASGNGVTDGSTSVITDMGGAVNRLVGKAALVQSGVALKKIVLPTTSFSDRLMVEFWLLNPHQMGQVFNNPNSYLKIQLYWRDTDQTSGGASSDCSSTRLSVSDSGTVYICPDTGSSATKWVERAKSGGMLRTTKTGQSTYYVVSTVIVPGGVPAGQQTSATSNLSFWMNVTLR